MLQLSFRIIFEKMNSMIKHSDWVPHGGLPTCLTCHFVPKKEDGSDKQSPSESEIFTKHQNPYVAWTRITRNLRSLTSQLFILLLAVTLLSEVVVARPMYHNSRGRGRSRRGPKPKWVNPCGIDPVMAKNHALQMYHDVTPLSDQELIQNILLSAKNALVHSDDFKEKFVRRTFSTSSWRDHHETWKEQRYNWLPSWKDIPKHLHESLEGGHLQKLKLDTALARMYNYLQRFAVGLEEVVIDQALFDGEFIQEFNEAEYKLKAVLCELQMAMLERDIDIGTDVSRDIMKDDVRDIQDQSYRNLRDWYIYRDYMNGLEYVIHAFDHLKKHHH